VAAPDTVAGAASGGATANAGDQLNGAMATARPDAAGAATVAPGAKGKTAEPLFAVQLGTASRSEAAEREARKAARWFHEVRIVREGKLFRLRVGGWTRRADAEREVKRARALGYHHALVVAPTIQAGGGRK